MTHVALHPLDTFVRKLESFAPFSNEERQALQGLPVKVRSLHPGQDIVHDGDQPSHCWLVLDGWVARYKDISQGRRQIMSFHIAGECPDLQSLHLPVMDHSLCAMSPSTVAYISHESLRVLMERFPRIAAALWRETLVDAAIFRVWMVGMGQRSARERIAHLFCEMYVKLHAVGLAEHHRVEWPLTQSSMAHALGLSNVHVNRAIQDLRGQGLVVLNKGTLTIPNWRALCDRAGFDPVYLHIDRRAAA
jgi:CRP-like cAMP-binding protein